jgi:hypothetical protein
MIRKQFWAALVILFAAASASANPTVVGSVMSSQGATVRGTALSPGSTLFAGDTIEVGPHGNAWIALSNGGQVQVSENSQAQITKLADTYALTVERGNATTAGNVSVLNHAPQDSNKDNHNGKDDGDKDDDDKGCEVSPHHRHHKHDRHHEHNGDSDDHCHDD